MSMNGSERLSGGEERALDCLVHGLAHVVATYGREEGQRLAAQAVLLINEVEDSADIAPCGRGVRPVRSLEQTA